MRALKKLLLVGMLSACSSNSSYRTFFEAHVGSYESEEGLYFVSVTDTRKIYDESFHSYLESLTRALAETKCLSRPVLFENEFEVSSFIGHKKDGSASGFQFVQINFRCGI